MSAPAQHKPGPWMAQINPRQHAVISPDGFDIALVSASGFDSEANARLMLSAPELLAALRKAETWITTFSDQVNNPTGPLANDLAEIRAAIAKATGGAA